MILELEETKEWLRIDGNDEDMIIEHLIGSAEAYLKNATGKEFDNTNKLAQTFCLVLVTDWFENRELMAGKVSDKVRYSIQSMLTQLQYIPEKQKGE